MKIRMLENVRPDLVFLAKPGTILRCGKVYEATENKYGAVSGICENGEVLGVKPDEFELVGEIREVCIPSREQHEGICSTRVKLEWICPVCGEKRGDLHTAQSFDGSRRLDCNGWENPCGHVDKYSNCRSEARYNGLNEEEKL